MIGTSVPGPGGMPSGISRFGSLLLPHAVSARSTDAVASTQIREITSPSCTRKVIES
jgi:hypothetical protein